MAYLVNTTLANFAAMIKTDSDKTVVVATLESLDDLLKALKKLSLPMTEETLDGLIVAVQDILDNKVCMVCRTQIPHYHQYMCGYGWGYYPSSPI